MTDFFSDFGDSGLTTGADYYNPIGVTNDYSGLDQYGNVDPNSAFFSPSNTPGTPATQYNSITPSEPFFNLNSLGPPSTGTTNPSKIDLSSLGNLLGNLATKIVTPTAQGGFGLIPNTNNVVSAGVPSIGGLLSNPVVLIGGIVVLILILK